MSVAEPKPYMGKQGALQWADARAYVGRTCAIVWQDRSGREQTVLAKIYDTAYVPLYGAFFTTETGDICLDRIRTISIVEATRLVPARAA